MIDSSVYLRGIEQVIWLSINDYSHKHKTSASTLRRRIRGHEIPFKFEDGKYLLPDEPMDSLFRAHRPSLISDSASSSIHQFEDDLTDGFANDAKPLTSSNIEKSPLQTFISTAAPPVLEKSDKIEKTLNQKILADEIVESLLGEIKKAYASVLGEKEEQILQLKEEVADLKTLVCVLEGEVERLKHYN